MLSGRVRNWIGADGGSASRPVSAVGNWAGYVIFLLCSIPFLMWSINLWRAGYRPDLHKCIEFGAHEWRGYIEAFFICQPQCLEALNFPVYGFMFSLASLQSRHKEDSFHPRSSCLHVSYTSGYVS